MKLVIDASIIIAALIKDSTTRETIFHTELELYTPEYVFDEIKKHYSEVIKKARITIEQFEIILNLLLTRIRIIPKSEYISKFREAEELIGHIDKDDIPYFALAIALNSEGIWTLDQHFKEQNVIKIYSTSDLIKLLFT